LEADEVIDTTLPWERGKRAFTRRVPHLVLAWSLDEPDRLGEVVPITRTSSVGRGGPLDDDPAPRTTLHQMRPGSLVAGAPIASARIGRRQLTHAVLDVRASDPGGVR